ncbi:hypothetical protein EJ06DRAFT_527197 [Trichodelitschia bisporula]|uniref:Zn(2)-C6 fungal-type domain-containing protein n=1 Tax=Trichodelitschia bisporula TaxID=703511 RepID=A0A6G1I5N2_9PEZI|nr:hypothetical protein EJ06DRAFT_527197 [Trichodelitschia bisporula]
MKEVAQRPATEDSNGAASQSMSSDGTEKETDPNNGRAPQRAASSGTGENGVGKASKKRRKVNHACIYCRRSHMTCDLERPCTRCIKRNIGHMCHDEPREPAKKAKSESGAAAGEADGQPKLDTSAPEAVLNPLDPNRQDAGLNLTQMPQNRAASTTALIQPTPVPAPHHSAMSTSMLSYPGWGVDSQSNLVQDMHNFHPSYMFNTSEVSNEYNLLNSFLNNSLLENDGLYPSDEVNNLFTDPSLTSSIHPMQNNNPSLLMPNQQVNQMPPPSQAAAGNSISRPSSAFPIDKAREAYYMTAADPAGSEAPEERLKKLLKAKYDAGMLKPFNYVKGYARLNTYMETHLHPFFRTKIIRQLDQFRPKFRERIQSLTDMQLVYVEMAFERKLMEYDRVFASMAVPACCWRRTGEIFRGNKEMAELIHVPIDHLRDGKIAIHEIFVESSLVSYWENFGTIAFDHTQKAILTACTLKPRQRESESNEPMRCCFSFTIRRDTHNIPTLIVGNFLPIYD